MMAEASSRLADRMRAGDVFEPQCRARIILKHVTNTWAVLALIALRSGKLRFGELRRRLNGVSERMLAQTLQNLEADGLLIRHSYNVMPPHVDYTLTELGQEAAERVEALTDWIEQRMPELAGQEPSIHG